MFRSMKSRNAASTGVVTWGTLESSDVRATGWHGCGLDGWRLGALPLSFVVLLAIAKAAPAQFTAGSAAMPGAVTVTPGSGSSARRGLSVAVVSATDAGGNLDMARRALQAANGAILRWPGYIAIPPASVANALSRVSARGGLYATDYQTIGKRLHAARLLAITLVPGPQSDSSSTYTAIAELYDGKSGGLVNRGQAPFTATADNAPAGVAGNLGGADGLRQRAVESAVFAAIAALNEPIALHGTVVSMPGAYQARISAGERSGLRNGAMIEYLSNGQPVAYGTVVEVDVNTAVATVASEAANPAVEINSEFRTITNPPAGRAGTTLRQQDDQSWNKFERDFAIAAIPALAYQYYLYGF